MAQEMIAQIREAEQDSLRIEQEAKAKVASILALSEQRANALFAQMREDCLAHRKEILAAAEREGAALIEQERLQTDHDCAVLRQEAAARQEAAIDQAITLLNQNA